MKTRHIGHWYLQTRKKNPMSYIILLFIIVSVSYTSDVVNYEHDIMLDTGVASEII